MNRWWLVMGCLLTAQPSQAGDNVWFSFQNLPNWRECVDLGRRKAVIGPRAVNAGIADSLEAHGVSVRVWVQPQAPTIGQVPGSGHFGDPYRQYPFDDALWDIVDAYGPAMNAAGDTVGPCVDDNCAGILLDMRNPDVVNAWTALLRSLGRPPVFDHGCESAAWERSLKFNAQEWADWAVGYRNAKQAVRPLCLCSATYSTWKEDGCAGLWMERIGDGTIGNSFQDAWEVCRSAPASHLLMLSDSFHSPGYAELPRRRRAAAAIAVLTDQDMNWGFNTAQGNRRIPELDDLYVGPMLSPPAELAPGVWFGQGTHGFAVLNLTSSSYPFGKYTLEPEDGLVVQTSGAPRGRAAPVELHGFVPNPAPGAPSVWLTLAAGGATSLEVYDLRGRLVLHRDLGALAPGSHVVPLGPETRLASGIYLLRLRQGESVAGARGIVLQ